MDKPYSLESCRSYCNDGQVFPAMQYKIDKEGKPKKQAAREVEEETDGAVTAGRAIQVYRRRGGMSVPSGPDPNTLDVSVYFYAVFHAVNNVERLPEETQIKIRGLVNYIWMLFLHDPKNTEAWITEAKETFPGRRITNEWHEGIMHCWCPKFNGKTIDIRDFIIRILKRPELYEAEFHNQKRHPNLKDRRFLGLKKNKNAPQTADG